MTEIMRLLAKKQPQKQDGSTAHHRVAYSKEYNAEWRRQSITIQVDLIIDSYNKGIAVKRPMYINGKNQAKCHMYPPFLSLFLQWKVFSYYKGLLCNTMKLTFKKLGP